MGSGTDPSDFLSPEEVRLASYYVQAYNQIMKCKALGLRLNASDYAIDEIDIIFAFHDKYQEIQSKRKGPK